jgi:uncharacterized protein YbbK (DUF523 family)
MEKILISKCLLGEKVNYLGRDAYCAHPILKKWASEGRLVSVCPEVQGGASVPRPAAAIIGTGGGEAVLNKLAYVKTEQGKDVTDIFLQGAEVALKIAKKHNIKIAILKARSPSCGSNEIYDGSFTHKKIPGAGVTTALLKKNGIKVFSEEQLDEADVYLRAIK